MTHYIFIHKTIIEKSNQCERYGQQDIKVKKCLFIMFCTKIYQMTSFQRDQYSLLKNDNDCLFEEEAHTKSKTVWALHISLLVLGASVSIAILSHL